MIVSAHDAYNGHYVKCSASVDVSSMQRLSLSIHYQNPRHSIDFTGDPKRSSLDHQKSAGSDEAVTVLLPHSANNDFTNRLFC